MLWLMLLLLLLLSQDRSKDKIVRGIAENRTSHYPCLSTRTNFFFLFFRVLTFFYNDLFCQLQSGAKSVSHLRQSNILKMWQKINGTYSHSFSSVIVQGVGFCEPYYDWTNLLLNITLLNQTLLQKNQQCSLRCFANLALKKANITQHVESLCLRL